MREAYVGYESARDGYAAWSDEIVPTLERASELAEASYRAGDESRLFFLESRRTLLEARLRQIESQAVLDGAIARLHYSVGTRVGPDESDSEGSVSR